MMSSALKMHRMFSIRYTICHNLTRSSGNMKPSQPMKPIWFLLRNSSTGTLSPTVTSSLATEQNAKVLLPERFRSSKSDPVDHTVEDIGLFYNVPLEDFEKMCPKNGNRKGFIRRFVEEIESFNEAALMIRRPALEVINYLKNTDYTLPVNRYLLYGDVGTGKSVTLQHITHYCMKQGWLILPTLQAWDWVSYQAHYKYTQREELLESLWNKERYDQPVRATAWLESFRTMNKHHLPNIKITKDYIWTKRDKIESGKPLSALVDQGISRPRIATDVIGCIMREVRTQPPGDLPKVLVMVDSINALFTKTWLKIPLHGFADVNTLTFAHNLKKLLRNTWTNGAVVVAMHGAFTSIPEHEAKMREGQYTYEMLGHEAFDILDPHIPVEVPNYTDSEVLSQLAYYEDRKYLSGRSSTDEGRLEIMQIACNNPYDLAKVCGGMY